LLSSSKSCIITIVLITYDILDTVVSVQYHDKDVIFLSFLWTLYLSIQRQASSVVLRKASLAKTLFAYISGEEQHFIYKII
ncbi:MAG: hypothetical protein PHD88_10070, partial [Firmicutes bacterium]|nr:hypothetical protein [Bacillota bacterium]